MIQRCCFVKLLDAEVATRGALAVRLADQLRAAGAEAAVGVPADDSARRWDLSLVITAPTLAAWTTLAATPAVAAAFDDLAARATVLKAWTFELV